MRRDRTQLALLYLPLVLSAVAILTAVYLYATCLHRPMASKSDCDRIEIGMSREQVEQILGAPPGDYRTRRTIERGFSIRYAFWDQWQGDAGEILVLFDEHGEVENKKYFDQIFMERSLLDRIRLR